MSQNITKCGMAPVGAAHARTLILGSLPGDVSIRQQQYYAHPQNQFWRILSSVFNVPFSVDYAHRLALLDECRIAVWDVLHSARRPGSLDAGISAPSANDFRAFFRGQPGISAIGFNGLKAAALFKSCVTDRDVIACTANMRKMTLPSTSPAAATTKLDEKIEKWRSFLIASEPTASRAEMSLQGPTAQHAGSNGRR